MILKIARILSDPQPKNVIIVLVPKLYDIIRRLHLLQKFGWILHEFRS